MMLTLIQKVVKKKIKMEIDRQIHRNAIEGGAKGELTDSFI